MQEDWKISLSQRKVQSGSRIKISWPGLVCSNLCASWCLLQSRYKTQSGNSEKSGDVLKHVERSEKL